MWILLPAGVLALVLFVPTIAEQDSLPLPATRGHHMLILLLPHTIAVIMILTLFDLVGYGRWSVRHDRFSPSVRIASRRSRRRWMVVPNGCDN